MSMNAKKVNVTTQLLFAETSQAPTGVTVRRDTSIRTGHLVNVCISCGIMDVSL